MSEFSESFHLRTNEKKEGIELLKNLGITGIVFDAINNWVTVLPEGELNSQISPMSSYKGTVLHYLYAEDHAWMTSLFTNGASISSFVCAWDPEIYIEDSSLNIDALSKLITSPTLLPQLEELFKINDIDKLFKVNPAYTFASLMGLEHYEWLSGQDIERHGEEILEVNSGAELIKA